MIRMKPSQVCKDSTLQIKLFECYSSGMERNEASRKCNVTWDTANRWYIKFAKGPKEFKIESKVSLYDKLISVGDTEQEIKEMYCYVLGLYFGDGYIDEGKYIYRMRIVHFREDSSLIKETIRGYLSIFPGHKVQLVPAGDSRAITVYCYSNDIPKAFPNMIGKVGRKHENVVGLLDWQKVLISRYPKMFLRGLVHSDGSRYLADSCSKRITYCFVNRSKEFRDHFRYCCSLLNIQPGPTDSAYDTIFVNRKASIEILDSFIGPRHEANEIPIPREYEKLLLEKLEVSRRLVP